MTKYKVYRTAKGNLTFTVNGEAVATITAKSESAAKSMLKQLKNIDKKDAI